MSEIWKLAVAILPSLFTALSIYQPKEPIRLRVNLGSSVDLTI